MVPQSYTFHRLWSDLTDVRPDKYFSVSLMPISMEPDCNLCQCEERNHTKEKRQSTKLGLL